MEYRRILFIIVFLIVNISINAANYDLREISAEISLKVPGNDATRYPLIIKKEHNGKFGYRLVSDKSLPVLIFQDVKGEKNYKRIKTIIIALEDIFFNFGECINTGAKHSDCLFYMPGFWYRRNLRSPKEAPSFHTSDSWIVREDRLSTPLTAIFDEKNNKSYSVIRIDEFESDALVTHKEGEVILSGKTSIGYTGFENKNGESALVFGYPYKEAPKTYIRKLTLAPSVETYQFLKKGETIILTWEVGECFAEDFSDCVKQTWEYCYDIYKPEPIKTFYSDEKMKDVLSNFFVESFVDYTPVKYYSGVELRTATCERQGIAEVGFVGRTLLNAFNALEYGESHNRIDLVKNANLVFDSYLQNGFSDNGLFNEVIHYNKKNFKENNLSIRRQSEGVYAILYYLNYEKKKCRKHIEWEKRIKKILDTFIILQNNDGSFPRKFRSDLSVVDMSGGSTSSATLPLVMGYKYFEDKRYLEAAKRSVSYLEKKIISKSDYFSSTLDANCEDKEASLYASTAAYYLALVTKGKERIHFANLSRKSAYFALSWYYTWNVPFAKGQILGDLGLKTIGWGNVSVENNHIDAFIFDFIDVLNWLSIEYKEPRFSDFALVINSSMRQLLPIDGNLCGIAKKGFYPEVVQHTNWDYGKNGKGFYNDIFAPGWVVASLWELLSPGRAESFLK